MSFSQETQEKIHRFAQQQAPNYLDAAEMTYREKLRIKAGQSKEKIEKKLSRFKARSDQALDAQNDMILYMSDYMDDLQSRGFSEEEAFEKAREELSAAGQSEARGQLSEKFLQYYESRDFLEEERAGLFYGGFLIMGLIAGALTGYALGGGRQAFLSGGWIDTLVGAGVGVGLGISLGLISQAIIWKKGR